MILTTFKESATNFCKVSCSFDALVSQIRCFRLWSSVSECRALPQSHAGLLNYRFCLPTQHMLTCAGIQYWCILLWKMQGKVNLIFCYIPVWFLILKPHSTIWHHIKACIWCNMLQRSNTEFPYHMFYTSLVVFAYPSFWTGAQKCFELCLSDIISLGSVNNLLLTSVHCSHVLSLYTDGWYSMHLLVKMNATVTCWQELHDILPSASSSFC